MRLSQVAGASTMRFAYDGGNMLAEYNSSNALQRRFVFGPGGQPIVWYEGTDTSNRRFLSADERGSVIAATDSSAALVGVNTYDEYGIPGAGNIGRFGYTGQAWLSEVGLQYSRARIYSPTLGRFLQTDPIGYGDGPNWYAYVHNDPVNAVDPLGTIGEIIICGGDSYLQAGKCIQSAADGVTIQSSYVGGSSGDPGYAALLNAAFDNGDDTIVVTGRRIHLAQNHPIQPTSPPPTQQPTQPVPVTACLGAEDGVPGPCPRIDPTQYRRAQCELGHAMTDPGRAVGLPLAVTTVTRYSSRIVEGANVAVAATYLFGLLLESASCD